MRYVREIILDDELAPCGWRCSLESHSVIQNPAENNRVLADTSSVWLLKDAKTENLGQRVFGAPDPS